MNASINMNGPVSEVLLGELKEQVRQRGLVVWLDPQGAFTRFADALDAGAGLGPVVRYRGSFARVLRDAAPFAREVTPMPLVLHLPGLDEAAVLRTPVLELAAAGHRWQRELKGLVTTAAAGRVAPEVLAAFVAEVTTLEQADAWLADHLADAQGGLSAVLRATSLAELVHQLLDGGALAARVAHKADLADLWAHLHRRMGLPEAWWRPLTPPDGSFTANDVAFALAGWALCVEYMHDPAPRTAKAPVLAGAASLPAEVVAECRKLAQALRLRDDFYPSTADETEARIAEERGVDPASLGAIDTFRFEEDALLREAIRRLDPDSDRPEAWTFVLELAEGRAERSFWVRRDERRRMAWRLVLDTARLAEAIAAAGPKLPANLDLRGAVAWYTGVGARVDQRHRILEQDRSLLLKSELPEFDPLVRAVDHVRNAWWTWASDIARDFSKLCAHDGFLPEPALQQRTLFEDHVLARGESGVTAYFMVDALRYEMAEALRATLDGVGTTSQLTARLAELPSLTAVGMNVLAPVQRGGKLQPVIADGAFGGFQVGEYRVKDPKTRQRAIQERVGGATCPWLALRDVVGDSATTLRQRIARARVVVVHSDEIDTAGESGIGLATFEPTLRDLREAWLRLREAGVQRFVFTADHGFLLLDRSEPLRHGTRTEPSRRHTVSPVAADHPHEVRVSLSALGYDGATGFLMMPSGLQVFDTGKREQSFVHGGNSLQERVIPVLLVISKSAPGGTRYKYVVQVAQGPAAPGMHRIVVTVALASDQLFGAPRAVDVVLRPLDAEGVTLQVWVGSELAEGKLRVVVGEPTELFFRLQAEAAGKVAVEVACGGEVVADPVHAGFFAVEPTQRAGAKAPLASGGGLRAWLAAVEDPGHRQVLTHLAAHGAISEPEVATMLGSPALGRKFARALDTLVPPTAPMQVRVLSIEGVKRYVKETG